MEQPSVIEFCKEYFGGLAGFARAMQVDRQVTWQWKLKGYVPPKYAFEVERVTEGRVTAKQVIEESEGKIQRAMKVVSQGE